MEEIPLYDILKNADPELFASMERELTRQRNHIELIARRALLRRL